VGEVGDYGLKMITDEEEAKDGKRRAGIQSVEIGLGVLKALASLRGPAPLSAVVARCGLSPSQTHRYLASLIASGMARQDGSGAYDIGPGALQLGLAAMARMDIFREADDALARFVADTGRTVLLAALGPAGPTIVRWHAGFPPLVTSLRVGSVLPLLRSATGWVFLAHLPEQQLADLIMAEVTSGADLTPVNIPELREKSCQDGHAFVDGTFLPGLRAFAFPIFDAQGHPALVATMLSSEIFSREADEAAVAALKTLCANVSMTLR
jgi:DNA-binding IclR family transcriptional regulator